MSRVSLAETACKRALDILVTVLRTGQYSVQCSAFSTQEGKPSSSLLSPEECLIVFKQGALCYLMIPAVKVDFSKAREKWKPTMPKLLLHYSFRWTESQRATLSNPDDLWRALLTELPWGEPLSLVFFEDLLSATLVSGTVEERWMCYVLFLPWP